MLLRLVGVSKEYSSEPLFAGVSLDLEDAERLGIIGPNGAGKSSLLKILAGVEEPDQGQRVLSGGRRVGYLAQEPVLDPDHTVREAVYFHHRELLELNAAFQAACAAEDLKRMQSLGDQLEHSGFYELEQRATMALTRLGLKDWEARVGTLSGGQKRRLALAQALTWQPDLLLLDEPTNHLDMRAIMWLEEYLRHYSGALVLITHDRYFLDRVTKRTLEVDRGEVTCYAGNYQAYLEKKAELAQQAEASEAKRRNLARRELEWLRRGPKARATKAKHRVETATQLQESTLPAARGKLEIGLLSSRLGKKVLEVTGLRLQRGERVLLRDFEFFFQPGQRLGLIGPNGCGKTSLLEVLTGRLAPTAGTLDWGPTVRPGYYSQDSGDLDPTQKVLENLQEVGESIPVADGRVLTAAQMLERFLFSGRLQHTPVGKLSGGEKRRLHLLRVLMGNPNFLLLDEPSNDLDIPTLQCLEDYLEGFPGTLLVSSHDRYLLDRTVEGLLAFGPDGTLREFPGTFEEYWEGVRAETPAPAPARVVAAVDLAPAAKRKLSNREQRELAALEEGIPALEERKAALEATLAAGSSDAGEVHRAYQELEELKVRLDRDLERWAELAELG